ncbi:hypothetical protein [Oscillatoria sp. FACHB-1407]|nr:hypothetical protein [Oscillatoria sp. FACHB-1407]
MRNQERFWIVGRSSMVSGQWSMVNGQWLMVNGGEWGVGLS